MATRIIFPHRLNKVFSSEFSVDWPDAYKPGEGRRAQRPKRYDNNSNDEGNNRRNIV